MRIAGNITVRPGNWCVAFAAVRSNDSPHIQVMIHARGVQPLLDMVLVFLGLPGALQTQRRHMVSAAAKSLLAVSVFSLVVVSATRWEHKAPCGHPWRRGCL